MNTDTVFHAGELAVQAQAGVQEMAQMVGQSIKSELPRLATAFLADQPFVVVASSDAEGRIWASILPGIPGFLQVLDKWTVQIKATPHRDDPLYQNLQTNPQVGLLVIEFATRRRIRVNGQASLLPEGGIQLDVQQAYSNCPKYIQTRELTVEENNQTHDTIVHHGTTLSTSQQQWLSQADTFFVASLHAEGGADASHRGGNAGFVSVLDDHTLVWPDYSGNAMFNTLGNIQANPQTGLLFLDFERGNILQVTGQAHIVWNEAEIAKHPGAERLVSFQVESVLETEQALPLSWQFGDYSPYNPS